MKMIKIILVIFLVFLTSCQLTVDPNTTFLKDQWNRYRFIRGVNVVYKQFPFYPPATSFNANDSLVDQDFLNLRKWGFNSLRLFMSWQGFQPNEGQYNYTYLQQLEKISKQAEIYGISILIDAHQDLYSKRYCGEGFPTWITQTHTFPAPLKIILRKDSDGNPLKQDCTKIPFFKYYASEDVNRFQNQFFTNKNGINDKFIKMWSKVVSYFASDKNVIGYDIINQPSGGNLFKNIDDIIVPGINNNKYLLPFYKKISKVLRTIDNQKLFLFQPSVFDYFGGFYENPGGKDYASTDVLSYHTYCPFKNQQSQPTSQLKCNIIDSLYMHMRSQNIKKLKIGGIMTEFGSVPNSPAGIQEIKRVLKLSEERWQNWYYWQYKYNADSTSTTNPPWGQSFYYPNGTIQLSKVIALSYPYAYAICGSPISQSHTISSYFLTFIPKDCGNYYTEIFINQQLYFPHGFHTIFTPTCKECCLRQKSTNYYQVIIPPTNLFSQIKIGVVSYI